MPGAPDPEYVLARKVLLDALQALGEQRSAIVLVGAQAIYLHTGDAELASQLTHGTSELGSCADRSKADP